MIKNGKRASLRAATVAVALLLLLQLFTLCLAAEEEGGDGGGPVYSGADYTDDEYLASRLDKVFTGYAQLFQNEDRSYPVGSSIGNYPGSPHKVAGLLGYECYIYANAVYYYLFDDIPFHGASNYTRSTVPIRGGTEFTYELFSENEINCGAYVRTTANADGSYNGNYGHSFIILAYDLDGVDLLQANNAGPGLVSLDRFDWDLFNRMLTYYWGGTISHVINPKDEISTSADGEVIHSWSEWELESEPTCYEPGYYVRVCADCGKERRREIPAGHVWDEGAVAEPPTWDADGLRVYVCTVCGEERYETIPMLRLTDYFKDVTAGDWFYPYVAYAYRNGLMKGVSGTEFAPNKPMNRAMIVTVLWRTEGEPEPEGETPFGDLTADWYGAAVAWAAENGIVKGKTAEKFAPDDPLTREQIAAITFRFTAYKERDVSVSDEISGFPDSDAISDYAREAVSWALGEGLIKGTVNSLGEKLLDPQGQATRAQVATILERYLEKYEEKEPADTDPVDTDPVDTDPADTDPVDTDPADTDPADTDPVETDPVDTGN